MECREEGVGGWGVAEVPVLGGGGEQADGADGIRRAVCGFCGGDNLRGGEPAGRIREERGEGPVVFGIREPWGCGDGSEELAGSGFVAHEEGREAGIPACPEAGGLSDRWRVGDFRKDLAGLAEVLGEQGGAGLEESG